MTKKRRISLLVLVAVILVCLLAWGGGYWAWHPGNSSTVATQLARQKSQDHAAASSLSVVASSRAKQASAASQEAADKKAAAAKQAAAKKAAATKAADSNKLSYRTASAHDWERALLYVTLSMTSQFKSMKPDLASGGRGVWILPTDNVGDTGSGWEFMSVGLGSGGTPSILKTTAGDEDAFVAGMDVNSTFTAEKGIWRSSQIETYVNQRGGLKMLRQLNVQFHAH